MDSKPTIAGVVLTLNEENDLDRSLKSLQWCDELLVLDSGSTDSTHQIAVNHGARFYTHIQEQPFLITDQRNWALEECGLISDWVLFIDADEEIGPLLRDEIQSQISKQNASNAYELTPRYWFLGRWLKRTQGYPNWHPRLLRRGTTRFTGGVWESFIPQDNISRLLNPYEHYGFSKGLDDWIDRHQRYSSWDALQIFQYRSERNPSTYSSTRFASSRKLIAVLWPLRPLFRFFQKYIVNLGFLEGWQGLLYCLLITIYDIFVVVKYIQLSRKKTGLPL